MKKLVELIRWFVGLLFIVSGLVKTVDPIGFSYKLEEYFSPQVFDMPFFMDMALPMSVFFVILEVMLGVLLILGVWRKFTVNSLLLLIVFFTFLTFYSAYFNAVTDCGCFGDALKLSPWESFGKDVVLLVLILILWTNQKYLSRFIARPFSYYIGILAFLFCAYIAYQGLYHLPLKDFRPYAVGKNIPQGMKTAEELGKDPTLIELRYNLKNKLTQQKVNIDEETYLSHKEYWETNSPWESMGIDKKVIKEGYEPPIHDFVIDCLEQGEKTEEFLEEPALVMFVTPMSSMVTDEAMTAMDLWAKTLDTNIKKVSLSSEEVVYANMPACLMDATTLKTIMRIPGVVLLKKGSVVNKYAWRDLPSAEEVKKQLN